MNESNLFRKEWLELRIGLASKVFCAKNGRIDPFHYILQKCKRTLLTGNHCFPVPLVNIERVEIVKLLVCSDGIHVGIYAISRIYLVFCKRHTLPLSQRMNNLCLSVAKILYRKGHCPFHTIEVVVYAKTLKYKQRRCHTA